MIFILIPALAIMLLLLAARRSKYNVSFVKTLCIMLLLALSGIFSTYLLYFIENGKWGSSSLFGAVLFPPILFVFFFKIFKLSVIDTMDFIAPSAMVMIAAMKANCILSGCCGGRILWCLEDGTVVHFPIQIVETSSIVLIAILLLYFDYTKRAKNKLYPIALVGYGVFRFALNFLRIPGKKLFLDLSVGNIWSLVAIISGLLWLFIIAYMNLDKKYKKAFNQ